MKEVHNFHRKRPHLLPPLKNLQPSEFRPMDPLQPPDLLLVENRLGSPAPRRRDPRESDYITTNSGKPTIKIFESSPKESEKCGLEIDFLSHPVFMEGNYLLQLQRKKYKMRELDSKKCDRENEFVKNFSTKQSDYLHDDPYKQLKSHGVLPLRDLKATPESKIPFIPSRYTPLKPIAADESCKLFP